MAKKIIIFFLSSQILLSCSNEKEIENYPYVIPPLIKSDYPEIYDKFKPKNISDSETLKE